jgi:monothiol glutaredoxin
VTENTAIYTEKIQDVIDAADVVLFMKGTPEAIMCGNSERALGALRRAGAPITAVDVLLDMQIREDLSAISGWPTIPQVFVKGELVGGADIVEDMERSGELEQVLVEKLGDGYWDSRGENVVVMVER